MVVEAISDPDMPTLPPHITLEQAKNFTETILRGDPNEAGIIKQAIKGMVESFVPHSSEHSVATHKRSDPIPLSVATCLNTIPWPGRPRSG